MKLKKSQFHRKLYKQYSKHGNVILFTTHTQAAQKEQKVTLPIVNDIA